MDRILKDIAKILNYSDSFFGEVESLGNLGFYEIDLTSGKFKASGNFKKIFNLPESSLYDTEEFQELIHPFDVERVLQDFSACMADRKNFENEYRIIVKGELRFICEKAVFIFDDHGQPVKVVGMRKDITKEKVAEHERADYLKKLEQAHDMVITIVHDLKAPMHNIRLIAELLKESAGEDQAEIIQKLEEAYQHSFAIIDDVLENRLTTGPGGTLKKQYCDIHSIIDKAVSTLYYTAQEKDIKILTSLEPNTYALVNPMKLQRAIENLLCNAVKFSHKNGQIEVNLYGKGQSIFITVEDFGLGMDEEQQSRLFQKTSSARKTGTSGEKSFGFGMQIVKHILHQHGGEIMVESKEAVGTKFLIELPVE